MLASTSLTAEAIELRELGYLGPTEHRVPLTYAYIGI